jgi:hypothetical protein
MERAKANARQFVVRARARFAASRAGIKLAALPPRTQRLIAGGGAAALVLVLVAGLVLGPLFGHGAGGKGASAATSAVAVASSSESPTASASPTANAGPIDAKVLATVDCVGGKSPVVYGGRLYVICDDGPDSTKAIAIDLASGKVVKNYELDFSDGVSPDTLIVDGGLWVGATGAVVGADKYVTFNFDTVRLDLTSGSTESDLTDMELIGDIGGTIVVTDEDGNPYKINAATGARSFWNSTNVATVADNYSVAAKCGSLWDVSGLSDGLVGVDLANGKATTIDVNVGGGSVVAVLQSGTTCWAEIDSSRNNSDDAFSDLTVMAQLGPTCMGVASRQTFSFSTFEVGDTFWEILSNGISQVDPVAGKVGPTYLVTTSAEGWVTLADGQFWLATDDSLVRLDIPVDQMAPAPAPASLSCVGKGHGPVDDKPIPTDSPSPSPSPSPSLSPSPSISPSPSPAPTGTPVATESPSPTSSATASESADASVAP